MNGGPLDYIPVNAVLLGLLLELRRTELSPFARVLLPWNPTARTHVKKHEVVVIHKTTKFCQQFAYKCLITRYLVDTHVTYTCNIVCPICYVLYHVACVTRLHVLHHLSCYMFTCVISCVVLHMLHVYMCYIMCHVICVTCINVTSRVMLLVLHRVSCYMCYMFKCVTLCVMLHMLHIYMCYIMCHVKCVTSCVMLYVLHV